MININLNRKKTLEYYIDVEGEAKHLRAKFVVVLNDNATYRFDTTIDNGIITVILPVLKEEIEETTGECFVELHGINGGIYRKIYFDQISFQKDGVVKLNSGFPSQKKQPKVILKKEEKVRIVPTQVNYYVKEIPKRKIVRKIL